MVGLLRTTRQKIRSQGLLPFVHKVMEEETVKMAATEFRIAAFIKSIPFELEGKSVFRVRMFQSKWKLAAWHVANWTYFLQVAFLWITFIWKMSKEPFGQELTMHLIYIAASTMGLVWLMGLYKKPRECLVMLNQHATIVQAAEEADIKIPHWASHYFIILSVYYFAFGLLSWWLVCAIMFLWQPTSSRYIYGYFPLAWQQSYAIFAVALFYELSWTAWFVSILGFSFSYWIPDIFTMNDILAGILSKERTTAAHVKMYRYLQIFCIMFNDYNGSFISVGFTTMVVASPVVFIFIFLTSTNLNVLMQLCLPVASAFSVFLIMFVIPQDARVGTRSTDCVSTLRSRLIKPQGRVGSTERLAGVLEDAHRRIVLKKRMRALAPFGIRIWFFGLYTLDTSQTLMEQLIDNVLLLMSL